MRLVTGMHNVGSGGKPLNAHFENLGFTIITLDENDTSIPDNNFSLPEEIETALSLEYDLENSLVTNLEQLEKGLKLYKESNISGQQYNTKVAGIIDLLAIDSNNQWVVIELKAAEADRQVCGQIQAYMGWVKENLAGGKRVRGIIVASDFTVRAVYAAKVVPDLELKKYQISFRFTDA
jgi:endonuclease